MPVLDSPSFARALQGGHSGHNNREPPLKEEWPCVARIDEVHQAFRNAVEVQ